MASYLVVETIAMSIQIHLYVDMYIFLYIDQVSISFFHTSLYYMCYLELIL